MPRLFHKNRSSHSLLSSQEPDEREKENKSRYQPSTSDSPVHSPAYPPSSQYGDNDGEEDEDDLEHNYGHPYRSEEARFYQLAHPTRTQSQRSPGQINTNFPQPTINLVGPAHSTPSSTVDETAPDSFYRQTPAPTPQPQKEDKKKRRFFGLGGSKETTSTPAPAKLGRSISVRRREQIPESSQYTSQQGWSSSHVSPTEDYEDDGSREAGAHNPNSRTNPPLPDKEPLRSPGFPPAISRQDYSYPVTNPNPSQSRRSPSDRQTSYESSWARASSSVHHHTYSESGQQITPASATSALSGHQFSHRSPNDSLHQPWQDQIPSRPSSQQSLEPPPPNQVSRSHEVHHVRSSSSQASSLSHYTQSSMVHPPPPAGPTRRTSEAQQDQQATEQGRGSGYQPYAQSSQDRGVLPSNAPPPYSSQLAPTNQAYRNSTVSTIAQNSHDQGRSTPPPSRSRDDLSNMDLGQLQAKHDELQEKYRKVKKYYFDKDAQVQQLQNTLAHQRLSLSRTSLDDNEYANRFSRLDGAINNLAFNLRREWRQVPGWLAPHVNHDACTNPTKEMTAVGRAAISRWLVDELLERYFHPGLDLALSAHLKIIEKNLRRLAPPTNTEEEKEMLIARISSWRLSTLDGLHDLLASPQAAENRTALTEMLIDRLLDSLGLHLKEQRPAGVEGGVAMIVELAVGIAANLPLESRDVFVDYVIPGQLINEAYMKVEIGLPTLTNPGEGPADGETPGLTLKQAEDTGSIDSREAGNGSGNNGEEKGESPQQQAVGTKKKGMFGSFIGGGSAGKKASAGSTDSSVRQQGQSSQGGGGVPSGERKEDRVRFSTFMAAQVRGRNVLVKAPVYVRD